MSKPPFAGSTYVSGLALALVSICAGFAIAPSRARSDEQAPADIAALVKADRLRTPISEGDVKGVLVLKAGDLAAPPMSFDVRIASDGARIVTGTGGERAGQRMLVRDDGFWLMTPGASHPVRLPYIQRMIGPAAFADIGRIRLSQDYDILNAKPGFDGGRILRLNARSEATLFQNIALTLDADGVPTRMTLLYPSGKVLREVTFGKPQSRTGGMFLPEMTIFDPIDPSRRAIISTSDFVEKPEESADFRTEAFGGKS